MVIYNISISGTRKQKGIKHDNMSSAIPHYHKQINLVVIYIYIDTLIKNARKSYISFEIYSMYIGIWYIYLYVKATSQIANL